MSRQTHISRKKNTRCGTYYVVKAPKLTVQRDGSRVVAWTVQPHGAKFTVHDVRPRSRFGTPINLGHTLIAEVRGESGFDYTLIVKDGTGKYCKVFAGPPDTCEDCTTVPFDGRVAPPKPPPKIIIDA